jgi:hypothetical protein
VLVDAIGHRLISLGTKLISDPQHAHHRPAA